MHHKYLLAAIIVILTIVPLCSLGTYLPLEAEARPVQSCNKTAWQRVGPETIKFGKEKRRVITTVWKEDGQSALFFKAKMAIDADGSPRAYNPSNTGLEENKNGKDHGRWVGIVLVHSRPHVQGPRDPFPGYYVSTTSLQDPAITDLTNPRRYVNSEAIPYIALPPKVAHKEGQCVRDEKACLGDIAFVVNSSNGKSAFAIVADTGPDEKIGEASIALAKALGIPSSPRSGGVNEGVEYLVFPGSGNEKPRTVEEINSIGTEQLSRWGGKEKLIRCLR